MNTLQIITVISGSLAGQKVRLVDARQLHVFLGVRRDFSNWIKSRIDEYRFEADQDFVVFDLPNLANQVGRGGDRRSINYFLTVDMAKELAMVERTPLGRQVRQYFIACERQWRQIQQRTSPTTRIELTRAEWQAINRQAWADIAGQAAAAFHARREEILIGHIQQNKLLTALSPDGCPRWARED